jgi:hypothetical protein
VFKDGADNPARFDYLAGVPIRTSADRLDQRGGGGGNRTHDLLPRVKSVGDVFAYSRSSYETGAAITPVVSLEATTPSVVEPTLDEGRHVRRNRGTRAGGVAWIERRLPDVRRQQPVIRRPIRDRLERS